MHVWITTIDHSAKYLNTRRPEIHICIDGNELTLAYFYMHVNFNWTHWLLCSMNVRMLTNTRCLLFSNNSSKKRMRWYRYILCSNGFGSAMACPSTSTEIYIRKCTARKLRWTRHLFWDYRPVRYDSRNSHCRTLTNQSQFERKLTAFRFVTRESKWDWLYKKSVEKHQNWILTCLRSRFPWPVHGHFDRLIVGGCLWWTRRYHYR